MLEHTITIYSYVLYLLQQSLTMRGALLCLRFHSNTISQHVVLQVRTAVAPFFTDVEPKSTADHAVRTKKKKVGQILPRKHALGESRIFRSWSCQHHTPPQIVRYSSRLVLSQDSIKSLILSTIHLSAAWQSPESRDRPRKPRGRPRRTWRST